MENFFFPFLLLMLLFNVEFTFLRFVIVTNIFKASVSFFSYFILLVCCINIAEKLNNIKTIYWKNQRTTRKKEHQQSLNQVLLMTRNKNGFGEIFFWKKWQVFDVISLASWIFVWFPCFSYWTLLSFCVSAAIFIPNFIQDIG